MFSKEIYIARRRRLAGLVKEGLILFLGNSDSPMNYPDNTYHFRQDSTFLYFFGLDEPGLAAVMDVEGDEVTLLGDDCSLDDVIWMGPQIPLTEKAARVGVTKTESFSGLASRVQQAVKAGRKIHFTPPYRGENIMLLSELLAIPHQAVKAQASMVLIQACIALRSVKEPCEIEEMERHMAVGYRMHTTAMQMAQPGVAEQVISGTLEGVSMSGGGIISFPVICSVRGETLHNHYHGNILKKGDLLLVDAGSESPLHYATDHTRTSPVGGRFSAVQRSIYQVVLNTNNAALAAIKPGVTYKEIHLMACEVMATGLKELGLMKGDVKEAVAQGAHALFMPHGLGHMLGLDVHDMEDYNDTLVGYDEETARSEQFGLAALRLGRRLQEGFTLTNEPGIYFIPALIDAWKAQKKFTDFINYSALEKFRSFGGIRLEDDILVTPQGGRILGKRIPIEIEEVEREVNRNQ